MYSNIVDETPLHPDGIIDPASVTVICFVHRSIRKQLSGKGLLMEMIEDLSGVNWKQL